MATDIVERNGESAEKVGLTPVIIGDARLHRGDCLVVMRTMADNSVDSIVCDPPYELGFMGKSWDSTGIAYNVGMWREALRVLKPGGHLLAFSGSRTYHRMTCAIEDAGFDIRDQIMWVYGSGFPKSLDVSKAIDGHVTNGKSDSRALREVNETRPGEATIRPGSTNGHRGIVGSADAGESVKRATPATDAARQWGGWGTALKPAHEPICVARKPLIGTVAANVLAHGTGALNIDGCRVEVLGADYARNCSGDRGHGGTRGADQEGATNIRSGGGGSAGAGRWPANVIHDGSAEVVALFPLSDSKNGVTAGSATGGIWAQSSGTRAGATHGDTSSAARFFYCAKASRTDRNEGLSSSDAPAVSTEATMREREDADWSARNGNHHPTVKPTDLLAYLCRLVTPPGGKVLDMFFGSGSTGKACMREGFRFVGIDKDEDEKGNPLGYLEIAEARIAFESARVATAVEEAQAAADLAARQVDMFAEAP